MDEGWVEKEEPPRWWRTEGQKARCVGRWEVSVSGRQVGAGMEFHEEGATQWVHCNRVVHQVD